MSQQEPPILFRQIATSDGHFIGVATLNAPKALNSLSLEMIDQLATQLTEWETDSRIVAVWLEGSGERAFCAGGDIVKIYQSMVQTNGGPNPYGEAFFSREYRLDYSIHRYSKPILCWGSGVVMGGGLGLMAGASNRIVTETARIAMPEISIGLFPDVGGTWFLNRMPAGCGLYLGLTGSAINASDALFLGLADHFVPATKKDDLLQALQQATWSGSAGGDRELVSQVIAGVTADAADTQPAPQVEAHLSTIQQVTTHDSLAAVVNAILALDSSDPWIAKGVKNLRQGCAITAHLVWEQLHRGRDLSLSQVFRQEAGMAVQCLRHRDFREGVRALLIDKDNQPQWQFARVEEVPAAVVEEFFSSPWLPHEHPLLDL